MLMLVIVILLLLGFFVGIPLIGSWLWNITMPYIFGLPQVEWWHILSLIILLWIILPTGNIVKIEKN